MVVFKKENIKKLKKMSVFLIFILISLNSFAAVISSNDGSSFITKSEFDSFKEGYETQINDYKQNINEKIDNAISEYLDHTLDVEIPHTDWELLWPSAEMQSKLNQRIKMIDGSNDYDATSSLRLNLFWEINSFKPSTYPLTIDPDDEYYFPGSFDDREVNLYSIDDMTRNYFAFGIKVGDGNEESSLGEKNIAYDEIVNNGAFLQGLYETASWALQMPNEEYLAVLNDKIKALCNNRISSDIREKFKICIELYLLVPPSQFHIREMNISGPPQNDSEWIKYFGFLPPAKLTFEYKSGVTLAPTVEKFEVFPDENTFVGGNDKFREPNWPEDVYFTISVANDSRRENSIYVLKNEYKRLRDDYDVTNFMNNVYAAMDRFIEQSGSLDGIAKDMISYAFESTYDMHMNYRVEFHLNLITSDTYWWNDYVGKLPPLSVVFESKGIVLDKYYVKSVDEERFDGYRKYRNAIATDIPTYSKGLAVEKIDDDKYYYCGYANEIGILNDIDFNYMIFSNNITDKTYKKRKLFGLGLEDLNISEDTWNSSDNGEIAFAITNPVSQNSRLDWSKKLVKTNNISPTYAGYEYATFTSEASMDEYRSAYDADFNYDMQVCSNIYENFDNYTINQDLEYDGDILEGIPDNELYNVYSEEMGNIIPAIYSSDNPDDWSEYHKIPALLNSRFMYKNNSNQHWIYVADQYYDKYIGATRYDPAKVYINNISFPYAKIKKYDVSLNNLYSKGISKRLGYLVNVGAGIPIARTKSKQTGSTLKLKVYLKNTDSNEVYHSEANTASFTVSDKPFIDGELDPTSSFHIDNIPINFKNTNELITVPNITCGENTTLWISFTKPNNNITSMEKYAYFFSDISIE